MRTTHNRTISEAREEKLERMKHSRLARECAKLNPNFEKAIAEESIISPEELAQVIEGLNEIIGT